MSDKAAGQKARSPEGWDENGPAAALLLSYVSLQISSFLPPVRLGPPCRRPILIATPLPQSLTWCTRIAGDRVRYPSGCSNRTPAEYNYFGRPKVVFGAAGIVDTGT